MKIVLSIEKGSSEPAVEQTFQQAVVRIGRDTDKCDIVFDDKDYGMVSRYHADIRFSDGKWVVGDMGSSFGTYLGDVRIPKPTFLYTGATIQFGAGGPKAIVLWLEEGNSKAPSTESPIPVEAAPSVSKPPADFEQPRLQMTNQSGLSVFEVPGESLWLGRDLNCDVVIESSAAMVSRRHAEIRRNGDSYLLHDNQSFNGTLVNEQRITAATPLFNDDEIGLGYGGPVLKFVSNQPATGAAHSLAGQRVLGDSLVPEKNSEIAGVGTMVFNMPVSAIDLNNAVEQRQLLIKLTFGRKQELTIGRSNENDIRLDGLQISNQHARLRDSGSGVNIEDLNSTNGVYVNGERITRKLLALGDSVQIGSFVIELDGAANICVYDTRSKTRIDAVGITKEVKNRAGGGMIRLLDGISISISPNEFVGLLGPSGAGKSTFMDALNGMRPPTAGSVYINNQDLYKYIDSLKQSIGYVPQDEIIHRSLTVEQSLFYIAKLRLSRDVTRLEIDQIINEVLDVTGLTERRSMPIDELSGGQRKRVSIAVELITKPSVIFLDEPTSGLDPATEEKIMTLFRQIAESGRTVVLTTHAMENVRLFDKVVVLMRGKLVYYGKPSEALEYFEVESFKALYDRLEEPVEKQVLQIGESKRFEITENAANGWRDNFKKTLQFERNISRPLREIEESGYTRGRTTHRLGIWGSLRQWVTLTQRYTRVLARDKFNLLILFIQAPVIALLVYFVMGSEQPRDFAYFALSLCAIWFGTSVGAREIVREQKIYERERMVNLGILPYLGSKYVVLGVIVAIQCLILFLPLKFFDLTGLMPMPGILWGLPQFVAMLLTAAVGVALGLFVSGFVKTSEMATSLIPLILIPQIIFSGLIAVPTGINKVVGLTMPAAWSFDTMKRYSTLDTLETEGALRNGDTEGKGLYKSFEAKNDKIIGDAKSNIKDYEKELEKRIKDAERRMANGEQARDTSLPDRPEIASAKKLPKDLSPYITFLHPWMGEFVNLFVLWCMFLALFAGTVIVLKIRDTI